MTVYDLFSYLCFFLAIKRGSSLKVPLYKKCHTFRKETLLFKVHLKRHSEEIAFRVLLG